MKENSVDIKPILDRETYRKFKEIASVKRISDNDLIKKSIEEYVRKNQVSDKEIMKHLDMVHQYANITCYGDTNNILKLYNILKKKKEEYRSYSPLADSERIDPAIKAICDMKNIDTDRYLDSILFVDNISEMNMHPVFDGKSTFEFNLWGGGLTPLHIMNEIMNSYGVNYIVREVSDSIIYAYSKNKKSLIASREYILGGMTFKPNGRKSLSEKPKIFSEISKEKDYYYFFISKGAEEKTHFADWSFIEDTEEVEDVEVAFRINHMSTGYTVYDKKNILFDEKYILTGSFYTDIKSELDWLKDKKIDPEKELIEKYNNKEDLLNRVAYLTGKKIDPKIKVEKLEKYLLDLNDKFTGITFLLDPVNKVTDLPYYI